MALKRWVKPVRPWSKRRADIGVGGVGVAGRDDNAGVDQPLDHLRAGGFGRQGHQGPARPRARSAARTLSRQVRRSLLGVVDAAAGRVQEGSLDVDAEHPRHAALDGLPRQRRWPRRPWPRSSLIRVGRKPVVPNRRCAAPIARDGRGRRRIVEQHPAAAVDLGVDEAGQQEAAREVCARAPAADSSSRGPTAAMRVAAQANRQALDQPALGHHPAVDQQRGPSEGLGDLGEVRGPVGSKPRASARAPTRR